MTVRGSLAAVVLAGGESRRFGADKLDAPVAGRTLLDRAVEGLPEDAALLVVGPERPLSRSARFLREDPPGGGPAAAMVTGLRAALAAGAEEIVVLPGDAPSAGRAAGVLLDELRRGGERAVVGTDATGFDQPLQLALTRAAAADLVEAAGAGGAAGQSARRLVDSLDPPAVRRGLSAAEHWDVDTPGQLQAWLGRDAPAVRSVLAALDELAVHDRPAVLAVDGRSASGKSTLADAVALRRPAAVVRADDFTSADLVGLGLLAGERLVDAELADRLLDWRRLRDEALRPLADGTAASFDPVRLGPPRVRPGRVTLAAADLVVLDGVYVGRPELADLVDLAVVVDVDEQLRQHRLLGRQQQRHLTGLRERGEGYYFAVVRQLEEFDLAVRLPGPA